MDTSNTRAKAAEILIDRVVEDLSRGAKDFDFEDTVERSTFFVARASGFLLDRKWSVVGEVQVVVTVPKDRIEAKVRISWIKTMHSIWWTDVMTIHHAVEDPWNATLAPIHSVLFDIRLSVLGNIRSSTLNSQYQKVRTKAWFYKRGRSEYVF